MVNIRRKAAPSASVVQDAIGRPAQLTCENWKNLSLDTFRLKIQLIVGNQKIIGRAPAELFGSTGPQYFRALQDRDFILSFTRCGVSYAFRLPLRRGLGP